MNTYTHTSSFYDESEKLMVCVCVLLSPCGLFQTERTQRRSSIRAGRGAELHGCLRGTPDEHVWLLAERLVVQTHPGVTQSSFQDDVSSPVSGIYHSLVTHCCSVL